MPLPKQARDWHYGRGAQRAAMDEHARLGGVLAAGNPLDIGKGFAYTSFPNLDAFLRYGKQHRMDVGLYEVIYSEAHAKLLMRNGHEVQRARFVVDMDYVCDREAAPDWDAEVARVAEALASVLAETVGVCAPDASLVYRMDASRAAGPGGGYKFSTHLVCKNVLLGCFVRDGSLLAAAVRGKLPADSVAHRALDMSIYTRNRLFRICGSFKGADRVPLVPVGACASGPGDMLIRTHAVSADDAVLMQNKAPEGAGVKRKRSVPTDLGDSDPYWRLLQDFLSAHAAADALGWRGAQVISLEHNETAKQVTAKVGFGERSVSHTCPLHTEHRGNCGQTCEFPACMPAVRARPPQANRPGTHGTHAGLLQIQIGTTYCLFSRCWSNGCKQRVCSTTWTPVLHPIKGGVVTLSP